MKKAMFSAVFLLFVAVSAVAKTDACKTSNIDVPIVSIVVKRVPSVGTLNRNTTCDVANGVQTCNSVDIEDRQMLDEYHIAYKIHGKKKVMVTYDRPPGNTVSVQVQICTPHSQKTV